MIKSIKGKMTTELLLFFCLIAMVALANGLSDGILSNYFKDAYDVSAQERAFIEFPRELPGVICVFIIAALSFLGDIKIAIIAQIFSCIGITVLGIFTPSFTVMLIFLFIFSTGMHVFMPLSDAIGMRLSEPDKIGTRIGQFGSVKTGFTFIAGLIVFIGFRMNVFSFKTAPKWVFLLSGVFFLVAIFVGIILYNIHKKHNPEQKITQPKRTVFVFRKEYTYYYMLTILHGVQKQIAMVFGSWVIIDLLLKGADVMSILIIVGNFLGIFFMRYIGKWIDTKGIRFMMFVDALSFIFIYVIFGIVVWLMVDEIIPQSSWMVIVIYALFILDRLSMQVGVVKSVYIKNIAVVPEDVTRALSTGISLDHVASIIMAQVSGVVWMYLGPQWVFFTAAFFSLGNLIVAFKIKNKISK